MYEIMQSIDDEIDHFTKNDSWRRGCVWGIIEDLEKLGINDVYFDKLIEQLKRRVNYTVITALVAYLVKTYLYLQALDVQAVKS